MSSESREAILERFHSIMQTISIKAEEINSSKLVGVWNKKYPLLFKKLIRSLEEDIKILMNSKLEEKHQLRILAKLNRRLDTIISHHDLIINTICKNTAIHEFVSYVLRDFDLADKIPYLICVKDSLETLPLVKTWKSVFVGEESFPHINDIITEFEEEKSDFYIIFIPPSILQKKAYWSLIVHEIGHIVIDKYGLIEKYHPSVPPEYATTPIGKNFFHSMEYVSDYIANKYCGPVFFESLYQYVFVDKTVKRSGTHPDWDSRLYFLQEKSSFNKKRISSAPAENHIQIDKIDNIVLDTISIAFKNKTCIYELDDKLINSATESLKHMLPFDGSPRIILNAYEEKRNEIAKNFQDSGKNAAILENDLGHIIEDSIRITNMKRTFLKVASRHSDS